MMLFFDDDGPKSLVRSTLMMRMFPSTVISTFFMPCSPLPGYALPQKFPVINRNILHLYLYSQMGIIVNKSRSGGGTPAPRREEEGQGYSLAFILGRLMALDLHVPQGFPSPAPQGQQSASPPPLATPPSPASPRGDGNPGRESTLRSDTTMALKKRVHASVA